MISAGRLLTLSDRTAIARALPAGAFYPAEFSFVNLWLFRERHQYLWHDEPVPHVSGITYDGIRHAIPLAPVTAAAGRALMSGGIACLYPMADDAMALAEREGWTVSHDPADSDYWFEASALAQLAGARTRRQQAESFGAQDPTATPWQPLLAQEARAVLAGWAADVARAAADTDVRECAEALDIAETLELEGAIAHTKSGEPVAFLLASRFGDARIVHFAKARRAQSAALPWLFARYARDCGAAWLNFEQDLGKAGFAQAKRAYAPARHQPKYRLFPTGLDD